MTKPQDTNIDWLHTDDTVLTKQLQALPQVEPSSELDAAILSKIEQALKLEAQQKKAAEVTQQAAVVTTQKLRQHFFQGMERKLKQFWFIPVGAMAMLLASVTLHQQQASSERTSLAIPAKEVAGAAASPTQNTISTAGSATVSMTDTPDQVTSTQPNPIPVVKNTKTERRTVVDKKRINADLAVLIEQKSQERFVAKESLKKESTSELAQLNENTTVQTNPAEKTDQVSPKPAVAPSATGASYAIAGAEAKADYGRTASKPDLQRIEVTGSSIKRFAVENSKTAEDLSKSKQTEDRNTVKTELNAVQGLHEANQNLSREEQAFAKVLPRETAAIIEVPKPALAMVKTPPPPPAHITHTSESYKDLPHPVDGISARLEQLISLGRTADALQLWKDFQENYPPTSLAPDLRKKLEELKRKQNTKKK